MPKTTKEQIEAAFSTAGAELLGDIFAWSVEASSAAISPAELRRLFDEAGLDADRLPKDATATSAARAAVREVCRAHDAEQKIIRENPSAIMWAIVDSTVDDTTEIGEPVGTLTNQVLWDRDTEQLYFKRQSELTRAIEAAFNARIGSLTWKATRDTIVRYLRQWGAFRLWGTGGVYFVPAAFAADVRKLSKVVNALGECGVIPVPKVADSERSIGVAARRHVAEEIARARREIEKWRAEGHVPRESTIESRLAAFSDLRAELAAFTAGLRAQTGDLEAEISGLVSAAKALVTGDAPADEQSAPEEPAEPEPGPMTPAEENAPEEPAQGASEPTVEEQPEAPAEPSPPRPPARPRTPSTDTREAKRVELQRFTVRKLRTLARKEGVDPRGLAREELVEVLVAGA